MLCKMALNNDMIDNKVFATFRTADFFFSYRRYIRVPFAPFLRDFCERGSLTTDLLVVGFVLLLRGAKKI